jgi:hypothetical protein
MKEEKQTPTQNFAKQAGMHNHLVIYNPTELFWVLVFRTSPFLTVMNISILYIISQKSWALETSTQETLMIWSKPK